MLFELTSKAQAWRERMKRFVVGELIPPEVAAEINNGANSRRSYRRDNVAGRFFREFRVDRIWKGTSENQRLIIAGILNKRGFDGLVGGLSR
ncbi:acyl-CoA dehydrogenase family protein [Aestuariispira insulae]|uniref:Acyl-CoA dehydrogenase-like protein n=1 Tax=Aestuariispira insulae TaxID=1461337 RepID=A0A3D9H576_9PROT|nr:acyl-CoA dehydrogenase family protein [Aestuariispira insulae]RED44647.1 acyl-CoA dehydrogenase-like protein [Aestuariispira insulae]